MSKNDLISGTIYLVGAGPGDPGLITLRGVRCLARADLVLCDCLVNRAILGHVSAEAEVVALGREGEGRAVSQNEVNARAIEAARQGKTVVRLKGGDPDVFGRGAEEIEAFERAGIPYQTVPGVTAALAAAGYAAVPITHAQHASAVALVTGQECHAKSDPPIDYGAMAQFPGTLIFYMGLSSAGEWTRALLERGKPADTPVAIVRRCSWSDQQTYRCTLGTVVEVIARREIRPPVVILVGQVVAFAPETSWFAARPLFGSSVLVTRPRDQAGPLCELLTELGARVEVQPAIRISDPPDWRDTDEALARLDSYQWVVFSSANGVRRLLDRLLAGKHDLRKLGGVKLAAIGPATAEALRDYHVKADIIPPEFRAESLASALVGQARGERFLLARASRGRDLLAKELLGAGAEVDQVVVYTSEDVETPSAEVCKALASGQIEWITITSSASARSLVRLFGSDLGRAKLASISPITTQTLRELGWKPAVEADPYTMEGLVAAIVRSRKQG